MLAGGFHAFEPTNGWRWTAGEAMLPAVLFSGLTGPIELRLDVECTTSYLLDGAQERRRGCLRNVGHWFAVGAPAISWTRGSGD